MKSCKNVAEAMKHLQSQGYQKPVSLRKRGLWDPETNRHYPYDRVHIVEWIDVEETPRKQVYALVLEDKRKFYFIHTLKIKF